MRVRQRALGTHVDTGDGTLAAAEVGAHLSGMEFSNAYAIAPAHSSVTKTAYYSYASFYRADGTVLEGAGSTRGRSVIARTLLTEPVLARLDHAGPAERAAMRRGQPNFFLAFDRAGIDPFTDRFPITLLAEGTVRGTGGIALATTSLRHRRPRALRGGRRRDPGVHLRRVHRRRQPQRGLGALVGQLGRAGGGAVRAHGARARRFGRASSRDGSRRRGPAPGRRREHHRTRGGPRGAGRGPALRPELPAPRRPAAPALGRLDDLWREVRTGLVDADPWRAREAAAMTAVGRWMYTAALARDESRGMHKREDRPGSDPAWQHRLDVGGLDEVWTRPAGLAVAA